jgi:hypothetical protein
MTQPPRARPRRGSRAKSFLIGLVIGLICAVAAYFVGQGKGKAGLAAAQTRAQQAEAKASSLEATNRLLQARALVTTAAADLEARNFGSAQTDIQSAAKLLETPPPGVDADRIAAIRTQLEGTTINVSDDVGRQRERLMDLAKQMDTLLPPPMPPTPPAPEESAAPADGSGA